MPSLFPPPGVPELPTEFRTLLVEGKYHASAPFHLAMSMLTQSPDSTAIIITPSRNKLIVDLEKLRDAWIRENSGHGDILALSLRIKILFVLHLH
jgi:hypothetical protein